MQELLLVNPRRRSGGRKKTRSAAQRAATARMLAANRARNPAKRRRARKSARRSNPLPFMHTAKRNPRRRTSRRASYRRRNPITMRSLTGSLGSPMSLLKPALTGAIGATLVNTALARMSFLPATLMTGRVRYATQAVAAIGLAMLSRKVGVGAATATRMAEGSLTVTLHEAIKDVAASAGMNLGGMGYYLPGLGVQAVPSASGNAAPMMNGMGKYISGPGSNVTPMNASRMGKINTFRF